MDEHQGVLTFAARREDSQRFFEAAGDLLVVIDEGIITHANPQWKAQLGWDEAALLGRPLTEFVHADDAVAAARLGQGETAFRFRGANGKYRWLTWSGASDGDRIFGSARDHTHRRDEAALAKAIIEEVMDYAIFMLDRDGHVRTWNKGAQRCKGYEPHEVIGRHFSIFYPRDNQNRPLRILKSAEANGRAEDEGWRVRKDGTRFWANVVITAVHDDDGNVVAFTKLTRDLTERRRAEEAERRAFRQAIELEQSERLSTMRATLLNLVAHELRTPLTPLRMQVQMLQSRRMGPLTEQQDGAIRILDRNLGRLSKLIEDILQVSRMEADKLVLETRPLQVADLVEEARMAYAPAAEARGIRLAVDAPEMIARGDPDRLLQVLYSLVDNAVRATPAGGTVTVRARQGDGLRVEVEDTGRGFAESQRSRLFEPFTQVHEDDGPGSGLALYIARAIVGRHGGTMDCSSPGPGRGATFWFTLPG